MNAREEAQDYYVMRFHKERNHRLSGLPERRGRRWPKSQPWFRHDAQHVYVREQMKAERAVSD